MRTKKISLITVIVIVLLLTACSTVPLVRLGIGNEPRSPDASSASQPQATATAVLPQLPAVSDASRESLAAQQGTLEEIYERVSPSVVNIQVTVKAPASNFQLPEDFPNPFGQMPSVPQFQHGLGSGFIWDEQGHIVTNNHVIDNADQVTVTFSDGSSYPAEVVGKDPYSDLAVLKVEAPSDLLKPVALGDSSRLKVGQMAIAIGNPYGLEGTMTVGIISALGRALPVDLRVSNSARYTIPDVIQTDAPINPGNSGGVLLNDLGQVIGVTFAIESSSGDNAGIGFAIPINIVQRIVPELIKSGSYQHPWLGISGTTLTSALAKEMNLKADQRGILIGKVTPGSPAEKAGLKGSQKQVQIDGIDTLVGGDVIVGVDGQPIKRFEDLVSYLFSNTSVGQTIQLEILRDGKTQTVEVALAARPANAEQAATQPSRSLPEKSSGKAWLGIYGVDMNKDIASKMNLDQDQQGVLVISILPGSPASDAGLKGGNKPAIINGQAVMIGGDVIIAYNGNPIQSMTELKSALSRSDPGDEVELTILRKGETQTLTVTLSAAPID